ncbi:MAG: outer membrane protein assembly factor BamA [Bdellovibrionales bacterium]|nr:outer membrane protein assembly factor BamA [Bdellovibrionales bacterium]
MSILNLSLIFSLLFVSNGWANSKKLDIEIEPANQQYSSEIIQFFQNALEPDVSGAELSDTLRRAYLKWPVYTIEVTETVDSVDSWTVRVKLKEIAASVELKGEFEISKKTLLDQIQIEPGSRYAPDDLETLQIKLKNYLGYRGFPNAKIDLNTAKTGDGQTHITIEIVDHEPCTIKDVYINNNPISDDSNKVYRAYEVRPGSRCDALEILKNTEKLKANLRHKNYLANSISKPELTYSDDRTKARLELFIDLGMQIDIKFFGNTFAFERDAILKNMIGIKDETEFNQSWIESKAKESIISFYREKGYAKPLVEVHEAIFQKRQERRIIFNVDRGPKFNIESVAFKGNEAISSETLSNQFWGFAPNKTKKRVFVEKEVLLTADSLLNFYQSQGYLRSTIDDPKITYKGKNVSILIQISEGVQSTLGGYRISGNSVFTNAEIEEFMEIEKGQPIDPVLLRKNADAIENQYRLRGYKYATVTLPKVEQIGENEIFYPIDIQEGSKIKFGQISFRGNRITKEYVIDRELVFESGDIYSPLKIRDSRRKLLQLGFFDGVSVEELPINPDTNVEDLVVRVSERKRRSVILRPGYSTDDGVRGTVEFRYSNLFGTGRNFNSFLRINRRFDSEDNILERRIVLTYREPYLLDKIHGKVSFIQERKDEQQFDIERTSFILGLERNFQSWINTSLSWELEFRNPFNELPGAILSPIDESEARFGSLRTFADFDRRNDLLNATSGTFHRLEFDFYNKNLLSDADFYQVFSRNNFYYPIYKRLRSILSLRLGFSGTYGDTSQQGIKEIPIEKRFRIGGNNSFRGVGLNCIGGLPSNVAENCSDELLSQAPGGNALFNYMFEVLIPIFKDFDFAVFSDGGNAYLQNRGFDIFDIRNSLGFGFRYNTFFGPMRLDYGILLDRRTGEPFGTLHFAVGQF